MNVLLPPDMEKFVTDQVAAGLYHSPSEVVRDGLQLLEAQSRVRAERLRELQVKIDVALKQTERGEVVDGEAVFARLEAKARALGVQEPRAVSFSRWKQKSI